MITVQLLSITIPVREAFNLVYIEWKRGDVTWLTKERPHLTPQLPVANFKNEVFNKNSVFYRDPSSGKLQKKIVSSFF